MTSIDEKFEKIRSIIINEAVKKRDDEIIHLEQLKKQKIEAAEIDILEKSYKIVQKGVSQARKESNMSASKKPAEAKKEVLMYRLSLIDELFCELTAKIAEYKTTKDYYNSICDKIDSAAQILQSDDLVITVDKSDISLCDKLSEKYKYEITFCDGIMGGVLVKSNKMGKAVNLTYAQKISELKQNFLNNVDFTIN